MNIKFIIMDNGANGSVAVSRDGEQSEGPSQLQLLSVDSVEKDLAIIESAIKTILEGLDGNTYRGAINFIAGSETKLNRKDPTIRQSEIGKLKSNLIIWKEFIGSKICTVLESGLNDHQKYLIDKFKPDAADLELIRDYLNNKTIDLTREMLASNTVCGIKTQGGLPKFDIKKRIKEKPEGLKTHWPEKEGEIRELLTLIDMVNLMIVKIELLSKKTVLTSLEIFRMNVNDIVIS